MTGVVGDRWTLAGRGRVFRSLEEEQILIDHRSLKGGKGFWPLDETR